jgi:uncharacterized protein (DUF1778 family)
MAKSKKNKNKPKLNLTVREEQRNKLEQMASLENRSVSNLIEVMANERWERLVEQQGVAYAKTVADAMNLKIDADNPADRGKLRRAILDLVAGRKMRKQKPRGWNSFVLEARFRSPPFHARFVVNANHSIMWAAVKPVKTRERTRFLRWI